MKTLYYILLIPAFLTSQTARFYDRSTSLNVPVQFGNWGVSVADFNKDGWDDIFIANIYNQSSAETSFCALLKNNLGENFSDVTAAAGIRIKGSYKCGVWGDINNDGYPDLFVADAYGYGKCRLYRNNTNGTFTDITVSSGINSAISASTAAFGDYDNDGRIDLFIATEFPEYDYLYKNTSTSTSISFADVTDKAGVGGFSSTTPMQGTFIDYDRDGDVDIYAVHDGYLPSSLFRNNGDGTFSDQSIATGLYDYGAGNSMGTYWKDYDFDGWEEVYVSRIGKGGLYKRQPDGKYLNIADSTGAEFNGMSWGIVWEDFDNDGDDDIYLVNNYAFNSVRSIFYENISGKFYDKAAEYGVNFTHSFYGLAAADFNNDGALDLVASATDGKNKLLINTKQQTGHWVKLSLIGTTVNAMAIGATVRFVAGGKSQRRTLTAGNSYASQMSSVLHAGFGNVTMIDTVEILWRKNYSQIFTHIPVDHHYTITEGKELISHSEHRATVTITHKTILKQNFPNPFNPSTTIHYEIPKEEYVELSIYDMMGRRIESLIRTTQPPGGYSVHFNATQYAGGTYICRLQAGSSIQHIKMIVIK